jgi:hypothetical protein
MFTPQPVDAEDNPQPPVVFKAGFPITLCDENGAPLAHGSMLDPEPPTDNLANDLGEDEKLVRVPEEIRKNGLWFRVRINDIISRQGSVCIGHDQVIIPISYIIISLMAQISQIAQINRITQITRITRITRTPQITRITQELHWPEQRQVFDSDGSTLTKNSRTLTSIADMEEGVNIWYQYITARQRGVKKVKVSSGKKLSAKKARR